MRKLQIIVIVIVMTMLPGSLFSEERKYDEFHKVSERIKISNLLNAMSLDTGQAKYILRKAFEAKKYRKEAERNMEKYYRDFLEACENLEDEVIEGRVVVEKETAKDFHQTKKKIEDIKFDLNKKLNLLASDIESSLQEHQLIAVNGFIPCLVPKVQEGRVGQEGGNKHFLKMLDKVRDLSPEVYRRKKTDIVNRVVTRIEKKMFFLAPDEVSSFRERIEDTFDEIRELDDADFSIQKNEIAHNLKDSILPKKNRDQTSEEKIKKFLLSEQVIEVLKKKLG